MRGRIERVYIFGEWQLDTRLSELRCAGKPLTLEPNVFAVLLYLIEHRHRVVSTKELMKYVWAGQSIGNAVLVRSVVAARRAIGDNGRVQRCIKTLRNRGYRFVALVEEYVGALPEGEAEGTSLLAPPSEEHLWNQARAAAAPNPRSRQQTEPLLGGRVPSLPTTLREGYIACSKCQQENSVTASFCGECGARLVRVCPACGHAESPRTHICSVCGSLLTQLIPDRSSPPSASQGALRAGQVKSGRALSAERGESEAERRQLTLLFCDLVDSTPLAGHLDPEELREVVRAYHAVCAQVIERFDGHIAQYLGDGLLVYFGYPRAHEDDAQRAVRAGLGIIEALRSLQTRLRQEQGVSLGVRVGIHTGLVVVGDMGEGARHERLALGEAPNLAARLQGLAAPDSVLISGTTARLVQGWFVCEALGNQALKGFLSPMPVYRVIGESGVQSRLDIAGVSGLTPLVGREQELELLLERWERVKAGMGHIVVLSGEAGIGKSRLVRAVQDRLVGEPYTRLECRCSSYAQQSALYPLINLGRRLLQWQRDEPPDVTLGKLEAALAPYDVSLPEVVPLLASLLSLPLSDRYPPPQLTPQRQKQKTLEAILALLRACAAQQPVLFIVDDLQWADPSTLEFLTLFIDQEPTARLLTLLSARLEFHPPWEVHAHMTSLTLGHLPPAQVEVMIDQLTGGKRLPAEVRQQVVAKTAGVPLFVEELTKMVLESAFLREARGRYELTGPLPLLAIPGTLQDSLMARLDRLATAKPVAQLGATIGQQFSFELLQAVSLVDDATLQQALGQLVEAELLFQRGVPPQATYLFKHALIQDVAYQSLLKSRRQQYHLRIAQVLEEQFTALVQTQPELLAYHCMEAGLVEQAMRYWHQAGEKAAQSSANVEAVSHFTKGLELLKTLPYSPERNQRELGWLTGLGPALIAIKGYAAPEVEQTYVRAQELCQQVGDRPQLFSALRGLWWFCVVHGEFQRSRELGEQLLILAGGMESPAYHLEAHRALGTSLLFLGEFVAARTYLDQGMGFYDPQQHRSHAFRYGTDPGVACLSFGARALWFLGYPDQALKRSYEGLSLAQASPHPLSMSQALGMVATLHEVRREIRLTQEWAEKTVAYATEQGIPYWSTFAAIGRDWALAEQSRTGAGSAQMRQSMELYQDTGAMLGASRFVTLLVEMYEKSGQIAEGLDMLAEALARVDTMGERYYEAELQRLKGELLLRQGEADAAAAADACFRLSLAIARRQSAKSWELRTVMSLARLWREQGKRREARELLAPIYDWFTEGFETADLQDAKRLLVELSAVV
jgi:class 3 adenylate cyclase/predicted ATPase/DNA-binding winged helix-turn-helix (wHTH) protein